MNNEKLFQEKLSILNEEFVEFISAAIKENSAYDLTPSVQDYVTHVKELDKLYAKPIERKIAVAKRRSAKGAKVAAKSKETTAVSTASSEQNDDPSTQKLDNDKTSKNSDIFGSKSTVTTTISSGSTLFGFPAPPKTNEKPPSVPDPIKVPNGLLEPAGQFDFASKVQMPPIPSAPSAPTFSAPKSTEQSTPLSQNRKRRPGEDLNYDDMLKQSSKDYGKADKDSNTTPKLPGITFGEKKDTSSAAAVKEPPPSFSFGQKADTNGTKEAPSSGLFTFGQKNDSTTTKDTPTSGLFNFGEKKDSTQTKDAPSFSFGQKSDSSSNLSNTSTPLFGSKTTSTPAGSLFGNLNNNSADKTASPTAGSLFGNLSGSKPADSSNTSLFGDLNKSTDKPPTATLPAFTFGKNPDLSKSGSSLFSSGNPNASTTTTTQPTNSLFGGLVKSSGPLAFNFGPGTNGNGTTPTTNGANDNNNNEDAEDAPPPKVEAVKHEEPDAQFSTKCSLFNFTDGEYKKAGVGYLFIKKTDDGTQLLIRAATSLGSVWVNTYINDKFKTEKKAKDKIQFSYPSTDGAKTHLIRVVDHFDDCLAYLSGEKKP